jgi:hypothetical protein
VAPTRYGQLIAILLARFWDQQPPRDISADQLAELTPFLIKTGAGALAWWRIKDSDLAAMEAAPQLHHAYRFHTIRSAVHKQKLSQLFELMRAAGVEPVVVKGWAVARLYPESGLRPYVDIDLCVRQEEYSTAEYVQNHLPGKEFWIDLHGGSAKLDDHSFETLYSRSRLVKLGEVGIRVLCDEDHLRVLCLHMLRHGALRPLWLCDIAVAVASRPADFDWDRCLGHNRRIRDWIACSIGLAHQLLGVEVTGTPVEKRAKALPSWLTPAVLKQWEAPYPPWRYYEPMETYLRHPKGLFKGLIKRWPNPIEATSSINGPFNEWPRFPFQIGNCILRATQFLTELAKTDSKQP